MISVLIHYPQHDFSSFTLYWIKDGQIEKTTDMTFSVLKEKFSDIDQICATVLIPTDLVSFFEVTLPTTDPKLLPGVLRNLLEEDIAGDFEEIHFSLPKNIKLQEKTSVAAIHSANVQAYINLFKENNISLKYIYPDCYLIPENPNGWAVLAQDNKICIRKNSLQGFSLSYSEAQTWLKHFDIPQDIIVYGKLSKNLFENTKEISSHFPEPNYLELFFSEDIGIQLLHKPFKPYYSQKKHDPFKWTSIIFSASIVLYSLYLIAGHFILSHRLTAEKAITLALYQKVFPGATQALSPRTLINRELEGRKVSNSALFYLLSALSESLSHNNKISLQQLYYHNQKLEASIISPNFDALGKFNASFDANSVIFKQLQADQKESGVIAKITLEKP